MRKHLVLYAACAAVVIFGQAAVVFAWHDSHALLLGGEVLGGAFTVVVTCAAFGDVGKPARNELVERGFERSWAVILIGLGTDLIASVGFLGLASPNIWDTALASADLLMTATLVFATVDATISDDAWYLVIPAAIYRSILVSWRPTVFPRALIILAVAYGADLSLVLALQQLLQGMHVAEPALWASGVAAALIIPFVQTFATFVYLDAIGFEPERSCSE